MVEALSYTAPEASATWISTDDGTRALELIEEVDVLVVCRALYSQHVAAIIARAKALGKRVLLDVDDLVFDARYVHLIMETLGVTVDERRLDFWFAYIGRLGATLLLCDGVIVTNEFLGACARDFADMPTWMIPNFLNHAQLDISAEARHIKTEASRRRDETIRIGYFSGTPSHDRDLEIVDHAHHSSNRTCACCFASLVSL